MKITDSFPGTLWNFLVGVLCKLAAIGDTKGVMPIRHIATMQPGERFHAMHSLGTVSPVEIQVGLPCS